MNKFDEDKCFTCIIDQVNEKEIDICIKQIEIDFLKKRNERLSMMKERMEERYRQCKEERNKCPKRREIERLHHGELF